MCLSCGRLHCLHTVVANPCLPSIALPPTCPAEPYTGRSRRQTQSCSAAAAPAAAKGRRHRTLVGAVCRHSLCVCALLSVAAAAAAGLNHRSTMWDAKGAHAALPVTVSSHPSTTDGLAAGMQRGSRPPCAGLWQYARIATAACQQLRRLLKRLWGQETCSAATGWSPRATPEGLEGQQYNGGTSICSGGKEGSSPGT
jgi:hypothetical protein